MKITDYEKVQQLAFNNVFLLDGDNGTKTILAIDMIKALIGLLSSQDFISGVNLSELSQIDTLSSSDKLLIGTATGNKAIGANDALFAILDAFAPVEMRRNVFRGKNLGGVVTAEQKTNIQNGTFKGFFLGDYWVIGGQTWRIVDFDYWYNCGDTPFTNHHLVIMPDGSLYNTQMNATNTTDGGYIGSLMYTQGLSQAKTLVTSAFGDAVRTHREFLVNAVSNGMPSGAMWYDSSVELPNECMMYGHFHFSPTSYGSDIPKTYTISKTQLALFQVCPRFIVNKTSYWMRDVLTTTSFAVMDYDGFTNCGDASYSLWVRPVFPIG